MLFEVRDLNKYFSGGRGIEATWGCLTTDAYKYLIPFTFSIFGLKQLIIT